MLDRYAEIRTEVLANGLKHSLQLIDDLTTRLFPLEFDLDTMVAADRRLTEQGGTLAAIAERQKINRMLLGIKVETNGQHRARQKGQRNWKEAKAKVK